jgi:hypothetical protein
MEGVSVVLALIITASYHTSIFGWVSQIKPIYIIPPFLIGKFTSDAIALHVGKFAFSSSKHH